MKKICKPCLIAFSAIVLLLSLLCISFLHKFTGGIAEIEDTPDLTITKKAEIINELGLLKGFCSDSLIPKLDSILTREELASLLVSLLGLPVDSSSASSFEDVSSQAQPYVNVAESLKYMTGDGNGHFNGSEPISKKAFFTTILRVLGYQADDISKNLKWLICVEGFEEMLNQNLNKEATTKGYAIDKLFDLLTKTPLNSESSLIEQLVDKAVVSKKTYLKHEYYFITSFRKNEATSFIPRLLEFNKSKFEVVYNDIDKYEIQIKYSRVMRQQDNTPVLQSYSFNTTSNQYFYPASTVKLPICLLTLEKVNALKTLSNINASLNNLLKIEASEHFKDTLSIKAHINNIFSFSSNSSYNCLYQFLGCGSIMSSLKEKGYSKTRICSQIIDSTCYDPNGNSHSFSLSLFDGVDAVYRQNEVWSNTNPFPLELNGISKGVGHIKNGKLVNTPISFNNSNYISLDDLHKLTVSAILPECLEKEARFRIKSEDSDFLKECMKNSSFTNKLFFCGKATPYPKELSIYNKYGEAYGYLIDTAYICDSERNVEFFLSAVIHVNKNQIYGDNRYEYTSVGYPFMQEIGWIFYNYTFDQSISFSP